jgi:DNA mismatch endonuclease (patch repair protein)
MPKTNAEFWQNKIQANVKRDKTNQSDLAKLGWQALVVWECDINKDVESVVKNAVDEIQRGAPRCTTV